MNAEMLIEEIQKLPPDEIEKVGIFFDAYLSNIEADKVSADRATEIDAGTV